MTAPTVSPRETRRPEFPATVHAYTDVLRELVDGPQNAEALAQATGRVPSNVRRDTKKLRDAGVIEFAGKRKTGGGAFDTWALTEKGRRWVTGIDVAEGKVAVESGSARPGDVIDMSPDRLRPDPDQPRKAFDDQEEADLASSIAEKGVIQPILVRPEAEDGTFMIIAGERRWRACMRIVRAGQWPRERTVKIHIAQPEDEADAVELALVENTQRSDLNHMELAQGYQRLFDLGRTPKQIAAVVGRTNDHVTQHLRLTRLETDDQAAVAAGTLPLHQALEKLREANRPPVEWTVFDVRKTPFGFEAGDVEPLISLWVMTPADEETYRVDHAVSLGGTVERREGVEVLNNHSLALDRAIDSLRQTYADRLPRPALEWLDRLQGPFFVDGVNCYNASNAQERRYAIGWDKRQANSGGAQTRPAPALGDLTSEPAQPKTPATAEPLALSPRARLALVELAHKVAVERRPLVPQDNAEWSGDREADHAAFGASVGAFWLDGAHGELTANRLAGFAHVRGGLPPIASLTPAGVAFLIDEAIDLPVDDRALERAQMASGLGVNLAVTYETAWLEEVAQPHAAEENGAQAASDRVASDSAPSQADPWGRSVEQVAADEALDAQVAQLALGDPLVDVSALFADFGVATAETCDATDDDIGVIYLRGADGTVVTSLTVDAPGELPTSRVRAIADLVAHQLTAVLG